MKITSCEVLPSVKEFFPSIKNELTKVTWAHEFYGTNDFSDARLTFPLWLSGITSNMNDKEIDEFLSLCTHNFPEATISIGFNRMGCKDPEKSKLDAELITKMKDTLTRNNVTQTVAFPIEVRSAALSLDTLPALKDVHGITDSALYIYGGPTPSDEYVRLAPQLRKLVENFGKDRVYLALGDKLLKRFRARHVF
uniref:Menorin-like domain-containing protein n=1 Tax=Timema bartmani TaxID=61472 RepID=A0A7R9F340_9NEOP|nr:unnamed protein product [Timema bartmani]